MELDKNATAFRRRALSAWAEQESKKLTMILDCSCLAPLKTLFALPPIHAGRALPAYKSVNTGAHLLTMPWMTWRTGCAPPSQTRSLFIKPATHHLPNIPLITHRTESPQRLEALYPLIHTSTP